MQNNKIPLLVIGGIADDGIIHALKIDARGELIYNTAGSSNLAYGLSQEVFDLKRLMFDHQLSQPIDIAANLKIAAVINEISEPDSHSIALKKAGDIQRKFSDKIKWFNSPSLITLTTRDNISEALQGIDDLVMPRSIRIKQMTKENLRKCIKDNKLSYPLLLRSIGKHGGDSLVKFEKATDLRSLNTYAYQDVYITEFVDFKDNDNVYQKYRVAIIGGKPYIYHVLSSDDWNIHASCRKSFMDSHPEYEVFEADVVSGKIDITQQFSAVFAAIYEQIPLDMVGVDFAIQNGKMVIFEVNANMDMLINSYPTPNIWEKPIAVIIQALNKCVIDKCRRVE